MKKFINAMKQDFQGECFTWYDCVVYGILAPCAAIGLVMIESWIDSICL